MMSYTRSMMYFSLVLGAGLLNSLAVADDYPAAVSRNMLVEMSNKSRTIKCAEDDNVTIEFKNRAVKQFSVEALNPVYAKQITVDNLEPNWAGCDMSKDPVFAVQAPPKREVLFENEKIVVYGITQPSFWRPVRAHVRIGDRVETNLHLLQLFVKHDGKQSEIVVMYPQDGYWRMKALPPKHLPDSGFGSSFLIGPVEQDQRPVVNLKQVVFDPALMRYELSYERGGSATVDVAGFDEVRTRLDVRLQDVAQKSQPFAVLRSMYVEKGNGDVESVWWRNPRGDVSETPIMKFDALTRDARFGRAEKWNRNTSAPDMRFFEFR